MGLVLIFHPTWRRKSRALPIWKASFLVGGKWLTMKCLNLVNCLANSHYFCCETRCNHSWSRMRSHGLFKVSQKWMECPARSRVYGSKEQTAWIRAARHGHHTPPFLASWPAEEIHLAVVQVWDCPVYDTNLKLLGQKWDDCWKIPQLTISYAESGYVHKM